MNLTFSRNVFFGKFETSFEEKPALKKNGNMRALQALGEGLFGGTSCLVSNAWPAGQIWNYGLLGKAVLAGAPPTNAAAGFSPDIAHSKAWHINKSFMYDPGDNLI